MKNQNTSPQYSPQEIAVFRKLNSPKKIQDFLETLKINFEKNGETCMSPRRVLRQRTAHCLEGAMLAAAALEFHGQKPLLLDLRSVKNPYDDDHVIAVFQQFGCWGAISKTNHAVLRYREPVYKTLRELVLSFFHEYFLDSGNKTLREYSVPVNLNRFNNIHWRTTEENLWEISDYLDQAKHYQLLSRQQIKNLRRADRIEIAAGKLRQWQKGQ